MPQSILSAFNALGTMAMTETTVTYKKSQKHLQKGCTNVVYECCPFLLWFYRIDDMVVFFLFFCHRLHAQSIKYNGLIFLVYVTHGILLASASIASRSHG